jgi:hypothetical protein
LITRSKAAQTRPCHLERARLADLDDFMLQFRAVTEGQLDQLATYLANIQSTGDTE